MLVKNSRVTKDGLGFSFCILNDLKKYFLSLMRHFENIPPKTELQFVINLL